MNADLLAKNRLRKVPESGMISIYFNASLPADRAPLERKDVSGAIITDAAKESQRLHMYIKRGNF